MKSFRGYSLELNIAFKREFILGSCIVSDGIFFFKIIYVVVHDFLIEFVPLLC